jgi:uncharacterized protein (DUF58 family)
MMIVPQTRLLFWVAILVLPLTFVALVVPTVSLPAGMVIIGFFMIAIADAFRAWGRLDDIHAEFPEIVRLTQDKEGVLSIKIGTERSMSRRLQLAIGFPPSFRAPAEQFETTVSEESQTYEVAIPCTPLQRGNHFLDGIFLETESPLTLWAVRKKCDTGTEVRVYPNLHKEQKNLAGLFLNRGMFGLHAQRQVGKGKEFEKLRDYIPGDSYEDIHWKATAKRSHPVTKIFQIERTQEIYTIIDSSRLSSRIVQTEKTDAGIHSIASVTQLERFITAALVLALVAEKQGDLFGLITFHDKVQSFVRARHGKMHYNACRDALYGLEPKLVNPDFSEVNSFIRLRLRRRALLIFLTNLDDPVLAENFVNNLDLLSRHHLILVNTLRMPAIAPLFSDGQVADVDDLYQRLGGHLQFQKLRELEKSLKFRGINMSILDNEMLCPQLVSQYINVKRRQLL